jgi:tetratricopeptide (TPR) repeat protein/transcriptional regulator with XRE-family HTH domain
MPVKNAASFAETLGTYVSRRGYSYGQLAQLSGVPKRTIAHWLEGIVARPRDWRDLVKVAAVLHLDEADATRLLRSAGHAEPGQLLLQADEAERVLLAPWADSVRRRLDQAPFQALPDLPHFAGRERECAALERALLDPRPQRLCSLHGMAGAGKTALAARLAGRLRPSFPDGVLWARLDNADGMAVLGSFARALGVDVGEYRDMESRSRVVRALLAQKRVLMVLDNVESSDQAEPLLPPGGSCAVLITSRRHDLAVARAAQRFQLGPFASREESLQLFSKLLGEETVEREKDSLDEIAGVLGDLPLALDIAACRLAYEPGWSAAGFLSRLRREQGRLGELVYENQSVRLSFGVSYERLSEEHKHFFHILGAFGGEDFSPEAAAHVAGLESEAAADLLRALYALSLLQVARPGRYRLHPLLRDLALENPAGDATNRMAEFFALYAETHRDDLPGLDLEIANLLAALETAFELDLDEYLVRGAGALGAYFDVRGLYAQAGRHLERAIQAAAARGDLAAQAALLCGLGLALIHAGDLTGAEERLLQGLEVTRRAETLEETAALIIGYLGLAAYFRGDYDDMEKYLLESLPLARAMRQDGTVCRILDGLNEAAQRRGDYGAAEAYCREGLALARRLEHPELTSLLLKSLANVLFERGGGDDEIDACLRESLALARRLGHARIVCTSLLSLGRIACERGAYDDAEAVLQEALGLMQPADFPMERVFILCTLGLVESGRGRLERSAGCLQEGLALARRAGMAVLVTPIREAWGWLYFKQGEWQQAAGAFSDALDGARRTGFRAQIGQALYGLARAAAAQGDRPAAREKAAESLAILDAIGHRSRHEVRAWLSESAMLK